MAKEKKEVLCFHFLFKVVRRSLQRSLIFEDENVNTLLPVLLLSLHLMYQTAKWSNSGIFHLFAL